MASDGREDLERLREVVAALEAAGGNVSRAAEALGIPRSTFRDRLKRARMLGVGAEPVEPTFEVEPEPDDLPVEEIIERRREEFRRKAARARRLAGCRVSIPFDGPYGILHFGDPHLDDPGCDIDTLVRHVDLVKATPYLFAATIGDLQNNWVGRLAQLYGRQETTHRDAWKLVEWFLKELDWLYVIKGNHDLWSGVSDLLDMMGIRGVLADHGCRIVLEHPNRRTITIHARHDFPGRSMWHPTHGLLRYARMHARDDLLIAGHTHETGMQIVRAGDRIVRLVRLGAYKVIDEYAHALGLPDGNFAPSCLTVHDPETECHLRVMQVFLDVEEGAEYLRWRRARYEGRREQA